MSEQKSMPVTIPATKAHRKFGELVRRVYSGKEHFIVEKDGLPVAAIMSMADYEELMRERKQRDERLKRFRELAHSIGKEIDRKGITEEQMMEDMERIRKELYQEHYGKNQ